MDDDECLDVLQAENTTHDSVDFHDAISFFGLVFLFEESKAEGHNQVCPSPEAEIAAEGKKTGVSRSAAEPLVGKVLRRQGEENGVGKELAGGQAYGLSGTGVREVGRREERESPA